LWQFFSIGTHSAAETDHLPHSMKEIKKNLELQPCCHSQRTWGSAQMWKRQDEANKSDAEPIPEGSSAPLAARPLENGKDATLVSNTLLVETKPDSLVGTSSIGKGLKFVGEIYGKEDLFVDGDLEGTVEAIGHKLTIGHNGNVHGTVKAREVEVLGALQGNVEAADRIEIRKNAKIVCDIRTARIRIEDGAYFKGSIDIVKPEVLANSPTVSVATPPTQPSIAVEKLTDVGEGVIN
jgi:cytoskeletal protein CcmA (bactofilin family)